MKIAAVCVTRRPSMVGNIVENLRRQSRRPDLLVVVTHGTTRQTEITRAATDMGIPTTSREENASVKYGAVLNRAMNSAVRRFEGAEGFLCSFEDDDHYGEHYFAQIEALAIAQPEALLIGKHAFWTRWPNQPEREAVYWASNARRTTDYGNLRTVWIAGATISIRASKWVEWTDLRYPDADAPVDGPFLAAARVAYGKRNKEFLERQDGTRSPFFSTGPDEFFACRYDRAHGHTYEAAADR